MKDSEFIELLNLYVDHEISAAQAARLEAEVTAHPERRKLYRQYCMIQKGCSQLNIASAEDAPLPQRRREAVMAAEAGRFLGWGGIFAVGGLAAAAFLAVLIATRAHAPSAAAPAAANVAVSRSASPDVRVVLPPQRNIAFPPPFSGGELTTVFNVRSWNNPGAEPMNLTPTDPLAWTYQVQLAPLSHDSLDASQLFKSEPMLLPSNPAASPVSPAQRQLIESAAFQFQR